MDYNFDWNPAKEKQYIRKHKLNFRLASTIFRNPYQLTIYDEEHSQDEDRWITIGLDETGILRVVIHTFKEINKSSYLIRIISARKATLTETQVYQQRQL
ncbi:BrnT family toxin [Okeania sp. SIO1F9]|uniref:BrnT family toxin n=1 Tax=Okeania sp. SIO1F9 TaxID=2607813 RepID=UPI00144F6374|nr:BrnT family toxin [Okeania sp. SIO1F9]NET78743.1 BrnT family toxin [Okeania sp. SIO1F9]